MPALQPSFRRNSPLWAGVLALILLFLLSVFSGNASVSAAELFGALQEGNKESAPALILYHVRLPRAFSALICGAGLSASGLLLQESLGNPLASPGILGVNAGAGLFVLIAAWLFPYRVITKGIFAFLGALLSVWLIYLIAKKAGTGRTTLILSGVAVSSLMTAASNALITFVPRVVTDRVSFQLGGLQGADFKLIPMSAFVVIFALVAAFFLAPGTDLFALGDEAAEGLGLSVKRHRLKVVLTATLLAGASVSLCGLLGFLGLMVPGMIRMTGAEGCRRKLLLSVLWGAAFLLLCDLGARSIAYPYELPAGLLLSLTGAPFFIFLLVRRRRL